MNNIQERVERSIYDLIRRTLVNEGYLADIENYVVTEEGYGAYNRENLAIAGVNKFYIQVYGQSSTQARGEKTVPRIVVQCQGALPGDIGSPFTSKQVDGERYSVYKHPYSTSNFKIDIIISHNTASHFRVCSAILAESLGTRNYIPFYDDPTSSFFIEVQNTGYSIRDIIEGVTDSVLSYQVKDIFEVEDKLLAGNGPLITEIKTEIIDSKTNQKLTEIIKP